MKINKVEQGKEKDVRIRDKQHHFLGKVVNGIVHIYCKRCGDFHVLELSEVEASRN
jgi:hypothetical protein